MPVSLSSVSHGGALLLVTIGAVILEPKEISSGVSFYPHPFAMRWWDQTPWALCRVLSFKAAFSLSSFIVIEALLAPLYLLPLGCCHRRSEAVHISAGNPDSSLEEKT